MELLRLKLFPYENIESQYSEICSNGDHSCLYYYFLLKKEKKHGHPRDYAEIATEKIIRAATEYNSISFYVDGDTLSGFHYELIEAFARDHGWKAAITPEMSFDKRLKGLADGEFDVIAYGILATSELKDSLLLTTPIVLNKQILVQRKATSPLIPYSLKVNWT